MNWRDVDEQNHRDLLMEEGYQIYEQGKVNMVYEQQKRPTANVTITWLDGLQTHYASYRIAWTDDSSRAIIFLSEDELDFVTIGANSYRSLERREIRGDEPR